MEATALSLQCGCRRYSVCIDNSVGEGWKVCVQLRLDLCETTSTSDINLKNTEVIGKTREINAAPNRLAVPPGEDSTINMWYLLAATVPRTLQEPQWIIFGFWRRLLTFAKISFTLIQQYIKLKSRIRNLLSPLV